MQHVVGLSDWLGLGNNRSFRVVRSLFVPSGFHTSSKTIPDTPRLRVNYILRVVARYK